MENEELKNTMEDIVDESYIGGLRRGAVHNIAEGDVELDPNKKKAYYAAAEKQFALADRIENKPKKESWWNKEFHITVKDILLGLAAPIIGFVGVKYTADKRLEEAEMNLEAERIKADAQIECERIRAEGRLEQLKLICKSEDGGELPDTYSLKVLNENNK